MNGCRFKAEGCCVRLVDDSLDIPGDYKFGTILDGLTEATVGVDGYPLRLRGRGRPKPRKRDRAIAESEEQRSQVRSLLWEGARCPVKPCLASHGPLVLLVGPK